MKEQGSWSLKMVAEAEDETKWCVRSVTADETVDKHWREGESRGDIKGNLREKRRLWWREQRPPPLLEPVVRRARPRRPKKN